MSTKSDVLYALESNRNAYLSGQMLSEKFNVSRAAICKAVNQLRKDGHIIEAVTNKGYRIADDESQVTEDMLRLALPAGLRNLTIAAFEQTDSTNIRARELPAGTTLPALIYANRQSSGRGRLGRSFHSPSNGIYMTLAIRPDFSIERSTLVTVAAAAAVAKSIDECTDQTASIKWVNDIYINDLKVCGILTEAVTDFESGRIEKLAIGIGVNTSTHGFPKELRGTAGAVSLNDSLGAAHARANLTARITEYLLTYLKELSTSGTPSFMELYRSKSNLIGKDILVYKGSYRIDPAVELGGAPALVTGIDDQGGLQVVYEDGSEEILTTGEVSIRRKL